MLPYALEGWLRRELDAAGAGALQVSHGMHVELQFSLPEGDAAALRRRLDDGGQGRLVWVAPLSAAPSPNASGFH